MIKYNIQPTLPGALTYNGNLSNMALGLLRRAAALQIPTLPQAQYTRDIGPP